MADEPEPREPALTTGHPATPGNEGCPDTSAARPGAQATDPVAAFSDFYRHSVPSLVGFLMWHGADLSEASDIAQETMERAWRDWEHIREPRAWTRVVASREYGRRRASLNESPVDVQSGQHPLLSTDVDIEAFSERHEVLRLLAALPLRQRQVLAWTYDGFSPTEIAEQLTMTTDAVRSSLFKARRSLAKLLNGRPDVDT